MSLDAQEILRAVNQKDLKAWGKIYESYYSALCSYANSIVKDSEHAKDLVQDILIKVWDANRHFNDVKDLTWYLYRAVYNNSLYYLRSLRVEQKAFRQMEQEVQPEFGEEQFALTVQEELIRQLYVYIDDLPKDRREVILLSLKGCSGQEIAETLGITINTVKKQKNRGFKYLREKLQNNVWVFLL